MALLRFDQVVRDHGVEEFPRHVHVVPFEHDVVVLDVLPHLFNVRIFQYSFKFLYECLGGLQFFGDGYVVGFARLHGEGDPDEFGQVGVDVGGLGIEAETLLLCEQIDQFFAPLRRVDQVVAVRRGFEVGRGDAVCIGSLVLFFLRNGSRARGLIEQIALCALYVLGIAAENGFGQRPEFEFAEHLGELFAVGRVDAIVFGVEFHRHLDVDGSQPFAHERLFAVLLYAFFLLALQLVCIGE